MLRKSIAVGLLSVVAGPAIGWAQAAGVQFVKPRNASTVLGTTTVELFLESNGDEAIDRIELFVDGQLLARLSAPPWSADWDAGDGKHGHSLQAVAYTQTGETSTATVTTSPLTVHFEEEVDLVNLFLVARDQSDRYVRDLERQDFRVFENGKPQTIRRFSSHHEPLHVAVVLDVSKTMQRSDKLIKAKKAALEFLDVLEPGDLATVVHFSDRVEVAQEETSNRKLLHAAIERAKPIGGTALYDAVWRSAAGMRDFNGRRVMVLLSDGNDEAYDGLSPGSLHTLDESLEQALRNDVIIYTIGVGRKLENEFARIWTPGERSNVDPDVSLADVLRLLAESTGGRAVIGTSKLGRAFTEIASDLRHQYTLAYVSDDPRQNGKWRSIRVEAGDEVRVITRKGYYAPRSSDGSAPGS